MFLAYPMTTIDGEAFVKGDAVIPESMIERELAGFIEAFLGASNVYLCWECSI